MTEKSILFPHLGLVLKHVEHSLSIAGLDIAFYGIIIALAMLAGIALSSHVAEKTKQDPELYQEFGLYVIAAALLGARLYYVAFSWDYYGSHPMEIINVRGGGLAIYGGILAGILTAVIFARRRKVQIGKLLDTAVPGLLIGQVIGRWGNFFNREAFGAYTDSLLAMALPVDAVNAADITEEMRLHMQTIDGIPFIQVHPTFLYESVWNALLLIILLMYTFRGKHRQDGQVFFLYLLGYGIGRSLIESLRTDQLLWPGSHIPVSQMLSLLLAGAALTVLVVKYQWLIKRRQEKAGGRKRED